MAINFKSDIQLGQNNKVLDSSGNTVVSQILDLGAINFSPDTKSTEITTAAILDAYIKLEADKPVTVIFSTGAFTGGTCHFSVTAALSDARTYVIHDVVGIFCVSNYPTARNIILKIKPTFNANLDALTKLTISYEEDFRLYKHNIHIEGDGGEGGEWDIVAITTRPYIYTTATISNILTEAVSIRTARTFSDSNPAGVPYGISSQTVYFEDPFLFACSDWGGSGNPYVSGLNLRFYVQGYSWTGNYSDFNDWYNNSTAHSLFFHYHNVWVSGVSDSNVSPVVY